MGFKVGAQSLFSDMARQLPISGLPQELHHRYISAAPELARHFADGFDSRGGVHAS
jgi:hypothetical protein